MDHHRKQGNRDMTEPLTRAVERKPATREAKPARRHYGLQPEHRHA